MGTEGSLSKARLPLAPSSRIHSLSLPFSMSLCIGVTAYPSFDPFRLQKSEGPLKTPHCIGGNGAQGCWAQSDCRGVTGLGQSFSTLVLLAFGVGSSLSCVLWEV